MSSKTEFLKGLDTRSLVNRLYALEDELQQFLCQESEFKIANAEYLSSYSSDCRAVEELMAGLEPPSRSDSKAMTIDQRKTWLIKQRKENPELAKAISRQHSVSFANEQNRIKAEMTYKRLEGVRIVLTLKIAQIRFLTGEMYTSHFTR